MKRLTESQLNWQVNTYKLSARLYILVCKKDIEKACLYNFGLQNSIYSFFLLNLQR